MKSVSTYIMCAALLVSTFCGCSTYRALDSSRLFSRETVIAFYALAPGESSPGPLYQRVMTFAPTAVFVADASGKGMVWSMLTPPEDARGATPQPESMGSINVGVVQILNLPQILADAKSPNPHKGDESASPATWRLVLLPEQLLSACVNDGFDTISRVLEQQGVVLALSPGQGYLRSKPVGSSAQSAVRYIAMPADPAAPPVETPWLTPSIEGGRYAILRAAPDRLSWTLYDGEGKLLDLVTVRSSARADGASNFLLTSEVTALMKYGNEEEPAQP